MTESHNPIEAIRRMFKGNSHIEPRHDEPPAAISQPPNEPPPQPASVPAAPPEPAAPVMAEAPSATEQGWPSHGSIYLGSLDPPSEHVHAILEQVPPQDTGELDRWRAERVIYLREAVTGHTDFLLPGAGTPAQEAELMQSGVRRIGGETGDPSSDGQTATAPPGAPIIA